MRRARARYLDTDDLETVNYNNNDTNMDDIETVDYNNGTNINDPYNINLRKTLGTQLAKQIIKNIGIYQEIPYSRPNKESQEDIVFLKQVPVHPRDRLA